MKVFRRGSLWFAGLLIILLLADLLIGLGWSGPLAIAGMICLAVGIGSVESLKSYQYTGWILVAILCGLIYPEAFLSIGSLDLRNKWLILIVVQLVMFGMGTQMSLEDFSGIKKLGKGVMIGIFCQFTIMPLIGFLLTVIFEFDPEIAAGIVLIGSCSSGLASNVMVYIAKANLTLSVTLTALATLIAPVMTPLMMKLYAGTYVEVSFLGMFTQIIKIVILPIGAALLADALKTGSTRFRKTMIGLVVLSILWLLAFNLTTITYNMLTELISFLGAAVIFGWVYFLIGLRVKGLNGYMPYFSMFGIVYFTLVTTAASRDNILQIGLVLLLVAVLHNSLGYLFGYGISRVLKLDKQSARTIALEVGLQNGGMASGLAGVMGKLATLGLASAVFSPWMNISGSLLANYWKRHTPTHQDT